MLKSLPDTIKELQAVRLATLLKRHPHSGQKQPPEVFRKKNVFLEILQNSQKDICARVSFLIIYRRPPATLLKKRLLHRCFPVNFPKFLRTSFSQNTSGRLLLPGVSKPAVSRSSTKQVFLNN